MFGFSRFSWRQWRRYAGKKFVKSVLWLSKIAKVYFLVEVWGQFSQSVLGQKNHPGKCLPLSFNIWSNNISCSISMTFISQNIRSNAVASVYCVTGRKSKSSNIRPPVTIQWHSHNPKWIRLHSNAFPRQHLWMLSYEEGSEPLSRCCCRRSVNQAVCGQFGNFETATLNGYCAHCNICYFTLPFCKLRCPALSTMNTLCPFVFFIYVTEWAFRTTGLSTQGFHKYIVVQLRPSSGQDRIVRLENQTTCICMLHFWQNIRLLLIHIF